MKDTISALLEAQKMYFQRHLALDSILLTATIGFFTVLFVAVYRANVNKKEKIHLFLPFVIGLYSLFCTYARACVYAFNQAALEIERKIAELTGHQTGMATQMWQVNWWKLPALLFYGVGVIILVAIFLYSAREGAKVAAKSNRRLVFVLSVATLFLLNIFSVVWVCAYLAAMPKGAP